MNGNFLGKTTFLFASDTIAWADFNGVRSFLINSDRKHSEGKNFKLFIALSIEPTKLYRCLYQLSTSLSVRLYEKNYYHITCLAQTRVMFLWRNFIIFTLLVTISFYINFAFEMRNLISLNY